MFAPPSVGTVPIATKIVPATLVAVARMVGAPGAVAAEDAVIGVAVTIFEADEVPFALIAYALKLYSVPGVSPPTLTPVLVDPVLASVQLPPSIRR